MPVKTDNEETMHRLRPEEHSALLELIAERTGGDDSASVQRRVAYEAYRNENMYKKARGEKKLKRICFEQVQDLLDILGLTWSDLLVRISTDAHGNPFDIGECTNGYNEFIEAIDNCGPEARGKVLDLALLISGDTVVNLYRSKLTGLGKLNAAVRIDETAGRKFMSKLEQIGLDTRLYARQYQNYKETAIPLSHIAYISAVFDVPLRWFLGLGDDATVFCENGDSETILSYYMLMPKERQNIFWKSVKKVLEG